MTESLPESPLCQIVVAGSLTPSLLGGQSEGRRDGADRVGEGQAMTHAPLLPEDGQHDHQVQYQYQP